MDRIVQAIETERDIHQRAVDEEGRHAAHAALLSGVHMLVHPLPVDLVRKLEIEAHQVEFELLGVAVQVLELQVGLVLEQQVVHGPEFVLGTGSLRRFGGQFSVLVCGRQWKMAEDEAHAMLELLHQHLYGRVGLSAGRAFEIAVLDDDDPGRVRARNVVGLVDGYGESKGFGVLVHAASGDAEMAVG